MADGEGGTDKKKIETKVNSLVQEARTLRSERAELINETWRLAKPHRRRIMSSATKAPVLTQADLADIVDATLAETMHDFGSDMIAQFTPESEPWVKFTARDSVPVELKKEVEGIIATTQMEVSEAIEESSYFDAAPQCFQDLANGTMAARGRRPTRGGDPFEVEAIEAADLLLVQSPGKGLVDSRFTEGKCTVGKFKEIYTPQNIALPLRHGQPRREDEELVVVDGFYRCWENVRGEAAWRRAIMVDNVLCYEKFVNDDPEVDIIVARWEVDGQSPWGFGAAFRAQPAQRALNELTALLMVATAKHVDPPTAYVDDGVANFEQGFEAGDFVGVSENFELFQWEPKGQLDLTFFTEQDLRQTIRHAMFQDKPEQKGKTPPTAEQWQSLEVRSRQRWEIPRGKIVREWVLPWVKWFQRGLEIQGKLGPDVYRVKDQLFKIVPNSPFAKARQQEEVVRAREILGLAAQLSPQTFPADVDVPATIENIKQALNDKLVVVRPEKERVELLQMMSGGGQQGGGGAA